MTETRIPLGRAYLLAQQVSREIRRSISVDDLVPVGGIRRFAPDVGQVALCAIASRVRHPQLLKLFATLPIVGSVITQNASSISLATQRGPITIFLAARDHAGAALTWYTGSALHRTQLSARARQRDLQFDGPTLSRNGRALATPTEQDLYAALGLPLIPPELRVGLDEIEAAAEGRLPHLVTEAHIRGDLHMHTTWSDGRDAVEDMVGVARQLGYEYLAITDHSERAMSARKLAAEDIAKQEAEIDAVRARMHGIEILHGVEVDIMPDGSLDFADDVLAQFDIVLASLHDHAGHDRARLTERCLSAIQHPLVNVITHPANRSPGYTSGYDLDFDRIFAAAAETGTALEVDGAPGHLDLDGTLARQAVAAGAVLTIDSDSHRAEFLARQMRFGVGTARRGWVEPHHVLNTRHVADVRAFIDRKRARA